jgi:hypothetical protein
MRPTLGCKHAFFEGVNPIGQLNAPQRMTCSGTRLKKRLSSLNQAAPFCTSLSSFNRQWFNDSTRIRKLGAAGRAESLD